jgi:predicted house-cleaning noncanonical NTP pyrophosphatase (MazG superfamily)
VIVRPIEPALIRNSHFAQELADLAKEANFAIELSGGLLSHAYHTLRRAGARVECVDLFGAEQDVVQFNKLVRDKIADRIIGQGERAETITLGGDALIAALKRKLVEESLEALDAISGDDVIGELADVAEVMHGICDALGVPVARVRDERKHKKESRGGFARGLMLVKTSTPHSVTQAVPKSNEAESFIDDLGPDTVILEPSALPSRTISQKPDLRRVAESDIEKMLTIDADLLLGETTRSTDVTYDTEGRAPQHYVLSLRLARVKDRLRAVVRLRRTATQLEFVLE